MQGRGHTGNEPDTVSALMAFPLGAILTLPTEYGEDEEYAMKPEKIRIWREKGTIMERRKKGTAKYQGRTSSEVPHSTFSIPHSPQGHRGVELHSPEGNRLGSADFLSLVHTGMAVIPICYGCCGTQSKAPAGTK